MRNSLSHLKMWNPEGIETIITYLTNNPFDMVYDPEDDERIDFELEQYLFFGVPLVENFTLKYIEFDKQIISCLLERNSSKLQDFLQELANPLVILDLDTLHFFFRSYDINYKQEANKAPSFSIMTNHPNHFIEYRTSLGGNLTLSTTSAHFFFNA